MELQLSSLAECSNSIPSPSHLPFAPGDYSWASPPFIQTTAFEETLVSPQVLPPSSSLGYLGNSFSGLDIPLTSVRPEPPPQLDGHCLPFREVLSVGSRRSVFSGSPENAFPHVLLALPRDSRHHQSFQSHLLPERLQIIPSPDALALGDQHILTDTHKGSARDAFSFLSE